MCKCSRNIQILCFPVQHHAVSAGYLSEKISWKLSSKVFLAASSSQFLSPAAHTFLVESIPIKLNCDAVKIVKCICWKTFRHFYVFEYALNLLKSMWSMRLRQVCLLFKVWPDLCFTFIIVMLICNIMLRYHVIIRNIIRQTVEYWIGFSFIWYNLPKGNNYPRKPHQEKTWWPQWKKKWEGIFPGAVCLLTGWWADGSASCGWETSAIGHPCRHTRPAEEEAELSWTATCVLGEEAATDNWESEALITGSHSESCGYIGLDLWVYNWCLRISAVEVIYIHWRLS